MKPEDFTSFEDEKPEDKKWLIVTNNIAAENAHGEMSHVWLTTFWTVSTVPGLQGKIVTYDEGDRQITGLTHWKYA